MKNAIKHFIRIYRKSGWKFAIEMTKDKNVIWDEQTMAYKKCHHNVGAYDLCAKCLLD